MKTKEDGRSALETGCPVDSQGSSTKSETPAILCFLQCGSVPLLSSQTLGVSLLPVRDLMFLRKASQPSPGRPATKPRLRVFGEPPLLALIQWFSLTRCSHISRSCSSSKATFFTKLKCIHIYPTYAEDFTSLDFLKSLL